MKPTRTRPGPDSKPNPNLFCRPQRDRRTGRLLRVQGAAGGAAAEQAGSDARSAASVRGATPARAERGSGAGRARPAAEAGCASTLELWFCINSGKMLPSKRGADGATRFFFDKNGAIRFLTDSSFSGSSSVLTDDIVSKLSSVVSITLTHGDLVGHNVLFASSGIAVDCQPNFTKFVTSADLVSALNHEKIVHDNIKIEVHHEGNVAIGTLVQYDLDHVIAVVKVPSKLNVYCVPLSYGEELMASTKVVAVGRDICGKLMMSSDGTLTASPDQSEDCEASPDQSEDCEASPYQSKYCGHLMFSTCILSEVMQGGALFGLDGNFVGMNLYSTMEGSIFLPRDIIFDRLNHLQTSMEKEIIPLLVKSVRHRKRLGVELHSYPEGSMSVNTSKEQFGDEYPTGVWDKFKKEISSNISDVVVALASFHGESKFFACTGFFIDYGGCQAILTSASLVRDPDGANEIVNGLRIEVLLPNKKYTVGQLDNYNLHYNIALVSVRNYNVCRPAKLESRWMFINQTVVVVGCCFETGKLMATSGEYIKSELLSDLDCEDFWYTTCRTTKAVIGGPVVDFNGKFMGISYYDAKIGTPFLFFVDIWQFLHKLTTTRDAHDFGLKDDEREQNIWVLPA